MGTIFKYLTVIIAALLMSSGFSGAGTLPPAVGSVLPEFALPVPQNEDQQQYLGVTGKDSFTIPEIKAEVVIIEIFSMY